MNFLKTLYNNKHLMIFLKSPIAVFLSLTLILYIFLSLKTHFQVPDFYTDRNIAHQYVQTLDPHFNMNEVSKKFGSLDYKIYNPIFKFFALACSLFIFTSFFRIKDWADFKNIKCLKSPIFIFLWINLSYVLFGFFETSSFFANVEKFVYHRYADSFGIPLLDKIFSFVFISAVYFPLVNLFYIVLFKTRIAGKFYSILCMIAIICFVYYFLRLFFIRIFTLYDIGLDLFYVIWITTLIQTLNIRNGKAEDESIAC